MLKTYRGLRSFEQESRHGMTWDTGGDKTTNGVSVHFAYQKPNRFVYEVDDAKGGVTLACDGKRLWIYSAAKGEYVVRDAPADMETAREALGGWGQTYLDPFSFLLGKHPLQGVLTVRHLGEAKLAGTTVAVIELQGGLPELQMPRVTSRLYIGKTDHLLYKTVTSSGRLQPPDTPEPGGRPIMVTVAMTKTHSRHRVNQHMRDGLFTFQPPRGARLSRSL